MLKECLGVVEKVCIGIRGHFIGVRDDYLVGGSVKINPKEEIFKAGRNRVWVESDLTRHEVLSDGEVVAMVGHGWRWGVERPQLENEFVAVEPELSLLGGDDVVIIYGKAFVGERAGGDEAHGPIEGKKTSVGGLKDCGEILENSGDMGGGGKDD